MVKKPGVTLVVLATLLAGFAASCVAGDLPTAGDIQSAGEVQSSSPTAQTEADEEPSGLTSSPGSAGQPASNAAPDTAALPTTISRTAPAAIVMVGPAATVVAVAPTAGSTATVRPEPTATPGPAPAPAPAADSATAPATPRIRPDAGIYRGPTRVYIENDGGVERANREDGPGGGNVYARGNGRVILRNTTVFGDQTTQDNGEIIVE